MSHSLLIAGAAYADVFAAARALGLRTVLADRDDHGAAQANAFATAEISSVSELIPIARAHGVRGIYAASRDAECAVAEAARALGLPGALPEALRRMRDAAAIRKELGQRGLLCPATESAASLGEAEQHAERLGLPLLVGTEYGADSRRVWRVDYIEDLSLAFSRAVKGKDAPRATLESVIDGARYYVDCVVTDSVAAAGIVGRIMSEAPFDFDEGLFAPPELDDNAHARLLDAARQAVEALAIGPSCVRVDVALTAQGPCVFGVRLWRPSPVIPTDLVLPVYGVDLVDAALRIAVGERFVIQPASRPSRALRWLTSRSGVVTGVTNLDHARSLPGIEAVEILAASGDVVGHIVDEASRDRIGYAIAVGSSATEALARANRVRQLCQVTTEPARAPHS